MKFDMSRAWNDAVAMMSANRDLLLVVAGIFFFLPSLASAMLVPSMQDALIGDPEQAADMILAMYAEYWWVIAIVALAQGVGYVALLALLRDSGNPTVGEALKTGAIGLIPYIIANVLAAILASLALAAVTLLGALAGPLVYILAPIGFAAAVYVMVKFCMAGPVIAIEKNYNPIAALSRSWRLTKDNSLRLFGFFALLLLVYFVLTAVVSFAITLVLALLPQGAVATAIQGAVSGLLGAVLTVIVVSILAATHSQLAGPSAKDVSETFE